MTVPHCRRCWKLQHPCQTTCMWHNFCVVLPVALVPSILHSVGFKWKPAVVLYSMLLQSSKPFLVASTPPALAWASAQLRLPKLLMRGPVQRLIGSDRDGTLPRNGPHVSLSSEALSDDNGLQWQRSLSEQVLNERSTFCSRQHITMPQQSGRHRSCLAYASPKAQCSEKADDNDPALHMPHQSLSAFVCNNPSSTRKVACRTCTLFATNPHRRYIAINTRTVLNAACR